MTNQESGYEKLNIKHIAFIMDGNRRYAKQENISNYESYTLGVDVMKRISLHCIKRNIKYATFFAFSIENWKRKESNVNSVMKVASDIFDQKEKIQEIIDAGAKIIFFGEKDLLSKKLQNQMQEIEEKSKNNNKINVQIGVSYSGRNEIVHAVRNISKSVSNKELDYKDINEDTISKNTMIPSSPDPEILVRTGNEYRISNFLIWQIIYCELFFLSQMWPMFNEDDLDQVITEFNLRNRRYGKD